jgi:hypothetical protein
VRINREFTSIQMEFDEVKSACHQGLFVTMLLAMKQYKVGYHTG